MQSTRPVLGFISRQVRTYHAKSNYVPPNMNELPVPCGSWKENHAARQRYYNSVLAIGVGFATFSVLVAKASGLFYFNWAPPKSID